jgi:hypothetical protein
MTDRPMTKRSLLGILLLAGGLTLLALAPQTTTCVTDYDLTTCQLAGNPAVSIAGLILILTGAGLAVLGLPKRLS